MLQNRSRNSSIELLRIITIIGVIILHYNGLAMGYAKDSFEYYYLYFIEYVCICAVNLFVLISAFFLSSTQKRSFKKVISLLIQLIIFRCFLYIFNVINGKMIISFKSLLICILPINYYIILYLTLYIISPYINVMINVLDKNKLKKLVLILFLVFSVWNTSVDLLQNMLGEPLAGLSTVGLGGDQGGYTIVNFVLLYFVGAYIRKYDLKISTFAAWSGIVLLIVLLFFIFIVENSFGIQGTITWNYNNPLIIILASLVLFAFMRLNINNNKVINEISKATFTCYLFHSDFLYYLKIESAAEKGIGYLAVHQIASAIVLFLMSYVVYRIYDYLISYFINFIEPICERVDISVSDSEQQGIL